MQNTPTTIKQEDLALIKKQFFPAGASEADINYCLAVANQLGLNPILHEIYFVERKEQINKQWITKVQPVAGRNAIRKKAHESGKLQSIKRWHELKEYPRYNSDTGAWEIRKELFGICEVKRKDFEEPFRVEVPYSEYVQTKKDGTPTKFWREKPVTMIEKVAEDQCLKMAFSISGIYTEEELGAYESETEAKYKNETLQSLAKEPQIKPRRKTKKEVQALAKENVVEAEVVRDYKKELISYLKINSIPVQSQKAFAEYANKQAGYGISMPDIAKTLLEDQQTLNRLIESFLDESMQQAKEQETLPI